MLEHLHGKKILLTGATGFVGSHVLKALAPLAEAGQIEVSAVVRASSRRDVLPSFVKVFEADLTTGAGLAEALRNQHCVVHMAALLFGAGWQDYMTNVQAASLLGKAVAKERSQGVLQRVVLLSSLAASGPSAFGADDTAIARPVSAYGWSKYLSEEALGRQLGDVLVTLRPPIIFGPEDKGFFPYFAMAQKGLVVSPGFGRDFPVSIMHVQDVVTAIFCALKPEAQGMYHCEGGHTYTIQQVGELMAELMGKKSRCIKMPLAIMCLSALGSSLWGMLGQKIGLRAPSWNWDKYLEARTEGWVCHSTRLRQELGFVPCVDLRQGLLQTIESYKAAGKL